MKKLLLLAVGLMVLASCQNTSKKWEYKTLKINTSLNETWFISSFPNAEWHTDPSINLEDSLNKLGQDGWEVVGTYEIIGTTFPNFGKEEYHTGIKEQVATRQIQILLKREFSEKKPKKSNATGTTTTTADSLAVEVVDTIGE